MCSAHKQQHKLSIPVRQRKVVTFTLTKDWICRKVYVENET